MNEFCCGMEATLDTNGAGMSMKVVESWYNECGNDASNAAGGK